MPKKQNKDISELWPLIIPFAIYGAMYKYLDDLEKNKSCECSNTNNRGLLKQLVVAWISVTLLFNLLPFVLKGKNLNNISNLILLVSIGLFICLSVVFVRYERQLLEKKCKCSEDIKRTVFRYYLYMGWAVYILTILFTLFYIFLLIKSSGNNNVVKTNL